MRVLSLASAAAVVAFTACAGDGDTSGGGEASVPQITGMAPPVAEGFPSVVTLQPVGSAEQASAPDEPVVIDQVALAFTPGFAIVRPGQTVEFRNSESDVAHNVRVRHLPTDSVLFNVGTVEGIPYRHTFAAEGGYFATCDIHPAMTAAFVVTGAQFVQVAEDHGPFRFEDIPPGDYSLDVWSMSEELRSTRDVTIGTDPVVLDLRAGS